MNRVQNQLEMLSIDVESGAATTIFQESDPHWINLDGDIQFLKDGKRFLWTSERDGGFRHIFLYSNDGKSVKQLTKGHWEVTAINAVDEAGGRILLHLQRAHAHSSGTCTRSSWMAPASAS